jgi:guanine deaminase
MMNLKILRLTGVASALSAISLTQAAEEASPKTDGKNEPNTYQEKFMKRAIEISRTALTTPGTEPFGPVIVLNGKIVGEGLNRALATLDVTSHGEIEAIRDANRRLKRLDLSDCEIYTSCEPCPLCVAAIGIARLKKMYYAAARDQCTKAFAVLPPNGRFEINVDALNDSEFSCDAWIENSFPERGMFSSLEEASRWKGWRSGLTHWIIALGDQPQIEISTLRLLLNASQQNPTQICQPVFCNFAAHSLILPKHHFFELAESYAEDLRTFVRNHEQLRLRIPVNDPSVTADLDTQEEYAHWHSSAGLPGRR